MTLTNALLSNLDIEYNQQEIHYMNLATISINNDEIDEF